MRHHLSLTVVMSTERLHTLLTIISIGNDETQLIKSRRIFIVVAKTIAYLQTATQSRAGHYQRGIYMFVVKVYGSFRENFANETAMTLVQIVQ